LADDPAARIVHALLVEVDGKLDPAGLKSLGIDIRAQTVAYGMSAFPVMRTSLSNADTLRATVQRVLDNAKIEAPALEFQGQSYWRYIPEVHEYDENGEVIADSNAQDSDKAVGFYIAILDDHMVFGVLPVFAEASFLPALLALEKPTGSTAESTLKEINSRFGYTPHGSGVIDFQKLVNEMTNAESLAGQFITRSGNDLAAINTDQCRQEISGIISHTPRAYAGATEFSENVIATQAVLETESSLATELIALVADVPVANAKSSYLAELALGIKTGPLRDLMRSKTSAIIAQPYQCEALAKLNVQAQQANDQLNQPMPPLVNNLLGLRVALSSFVGGASAPESAKGLIALHVTQPEMLVGMAQMLLPGLAELNMAAGQPPVLVPADMLPIPGMVLYAAQSKSAIGVSLGEGEQNSLADFINKEGKANGTFLSVNYDAAAFMDITGQLQPDGMDDAESAATAEMFEQMTQDYQQMFDRSDYRFSFSKDGFVVNSKTTFKNP
jgi:hypothetical protein